MQSLIAHAGRFVRPPRRIALALLVFVLSAGATFAVWHWSSSRIERARRLRFERYVNAATRSLERTLQQNAAVLQNAQALTAEGLDQPIELEPLFARLLASSGHHVVAGLGLAQVRLYGAAVMIAPVEFMDFAPGISGWGTEDRLPANRVTRDALEKALSTGEPAAIPAPREITGLKGPAHLVVLPGYDDGRTNPAHAYSQEGVHAVPAILALIQDEPLWTEAHENQDSADLTLRPEQGDATPSSQFRELRRFRSMGLEWNVAFEPGPKFIELQSHAPAFILGGGSALSVLLVVLVLLQGRNRAAKQLRDTFRQLSRFKEVAEATTDLVVLASLDGSVISINTAGRKMLGFDGEAGPRNVEELFPARARERFETEGVPQALKEGNWTSELSLRRRPGGEVAVSFVALILKEDAGQPQCLAFVAREITAQRQLEEQLRKSLEREREINSLRSNFINTISHEFRTPLGIILVSAGMLRRFDSRFGPQERAEQISAIEDAVNRMNGLVDQSLGLGWAEVTEPKLQPFDPMALCQQVVEEVQTSTAHRCRIWLRADGNYDHGFTDEKMLRTILANLLNNAVKYSPAGSKVVLQLSRRERSCIFAVRDQGQGLHEEDLPKLFNHFHRGQETKGIPGTGLGLAIVKRCTEVLGGSVKARNSEGCGAEFIVQLPIFANERETVNENDSGH